MAMEHAHISAKQPAGVRKKLGQGRVGVRLGKLICLKRLGSRGCTTLAWQRYTDILKQADITTSIVIF